MLVFGLLLDQVGRLLDLVAGLVDDLALNKRAGRDKDGERRKEQGQGKDGQTAKHGFGLPGPAQGDGLDSFKAAGMGGGIFKLQAHEEHSIGGDGTLRCALEFQRR